jgi:uncharacterized protein YjbJ (UPF0337 family)
MDKDRVKGTVDEVVGSTKRHIGNMTGNTGTQVEGAAQQLKGKVENAVGKLKDAGRNAQANFKASQESNDSSVVVHREVVVSDDRILP